MDKAEAREIAEKDLQFYRGMSYEALEQKIGYPESFERVSERGEPYQIEFDFFYDDVANKTIRVLAAVSYSAWTDFFPVSNDFIIASTGEFVGE